MTTRQPHRRAVIESRACAIAIITAAAACSSSASSQTTPHGAACVVQVSRQIKPPPGYIEVGQLSFDAQAAGLTKYHYTNADQLARDMHDNICAIGGELLTTESNALGVITYAVVYRRERELALPPPPPAPERPSRSELCDPVCDLGYTCEGGACIVVTPQPAAPRQ